MNRDFLQSWQAAKQQSWKGHFQILWMVFCDGHLVYAGCGLAIARTDRWQFLRWVCYRGGEYRPDALHEDLAADLV